MGLLENTKTLDTNKNDHHGCDAPRRGGAPHHFEFNIPVTSNDNNCMLNQLDVFRMKNLKGNDQNGPQLKTRRDSNKQALKMGDGCILLRTTTFGI